MSKLKPNPKANVTLKQIDEITVKVLARRLNLSESAIYGWIRTKRVPEARVSQICDIYQEICDRSEAERKVVNLPVVRVETEPQEPAQTEKRDSIDVIHAREELRIARREVEKLEAEADGRAKDFRVPIMRQIRAAIIATEGSLGSYGFAMTLGEAPFIAVLGGFSVSCALIGITTAFGWSLWVRKEQPERAVAWVPWVLGSLLVALLSVVLWIQSGGAVDLVQDFQGLSADDGAKDPTINIMFPIYAVLLIIAASGSVILSYFGSAPVNKLPKARRAMAKAQRKVSKLCNS